MGRRTFSKDVVTKVFRKARQIPGENPSIWRKDRRNRTMARAAYGDRDSSYGWDIHHIDGNWSNNHISNLEPVHHDTHSELH